MTVHDAVAAALLWLRRSELQASPPRRGGAGQAARARLCRSAPPSCRGRRARCAPHRRRGAAAPDSTAATSRGGARAAASPRGRDRRDTVQRLLAASAPASLLVCRRDSLGGGSRRSGGSGVRERQRWCVRARWPGSRQRWCVRARWPGAAFRRGRRRQLHRWLGQLPAKYGTADDDARVASNPSSSSTPSRTAGERPAILRYRCGRTIFLFLCYWCERAAMVFYLGRRAERRRSTSDATPRPAVAPRLSRRVHTAALPATRARPAYWSGSSPTTTQRRASSTAPATTPWLVRARRTRRTRRAVAAPVA